MAEEKRREQEQEAQRRERIRKKIERYKTEMEQQRAEKHQQEQAQLRLSKAERQSKIRDYLKSALLSPTPNPLPSSIVVVFLPVLGACCGR
eukprot:3526131-Rhodomonas_salina.1